MGQNWVSQSVVDTWLIPITHQTCQVGGDWNMSFMTFHSVGNVIIPTDELIFFRGVGQPPTSCGFDRVFMNFDPWDP